MDLIEDNKNCKTRHKKKQIIFYFLLTQTAPDGTEAVNVVGKNGYLILDIIAYKRDIPPFDLEIINGIVVFRCSTCTVPFCDTMIHDRSLICV